MGRGQKGANIRKHRKARVIFLNRSLIMTCAYIFKLISLFIVLLLPINSNLKIKQPDFAASPKCIKCAVSFIPFSLKHGRIFTLQPVVAAFYNVIISRLSFKALIKCSEKQHLPKRQRKDVPEGKQVVKCKIYLEALLHPSRTDAGARQGHNPVGNRH